jgi:hypothetical protein
MTRPAPTTDPLVARLAEEVAAALAPVIRQAVADAQREGE